MVIRSNIIGIQVTDFTRSGTRSNPYGKCLMLGSANTGTDRTLSTIASLDDFISKFGADSPSRNHVETFFLELTNTGIELQFYKVNVGSTTPVITDFTLALNTIDPLSSAGGIVISPEVYSNFPIASRKSYFDAAETFCDFNRGSLWVHIVDINPTGTTYTESDVASEKTTNYTSAMSGFVYYGIGQRTINEVLTNLVSSPAIAAYMLSLWSGSNFYLLPSDYSKGLKSFFSLFRNFKSVDTMIQAGVNPLVMEDSVIYPFSAVSGATRKAYKHINTVVCFKLAAFYLMQSVRPFVNAPISGDDDLPSKVKATLENECYVCYLNRRLLTGNTTDEAYTVTVNTQTVDVNDSKIVVLVELNPTYANQRVELQIINLLTDQIRTTVA
jgi:hypothetical protein